MSGAAPPPIACCACAIEMRRCNCGAATCTMQRVGKLLSAAGVCSRREAELLIEQRRLSLRDRVVEHPAVKLSAADLSHLTIDGRLLDDVLGGVEGTAQAAVVEQPRLWRLYKPLGTIVSSAAGACDTVFQLDR
jgi:16S rRNA U516 pseudouridylate synthase RsuA-like enzyme